MARRSMQPICRYPGLGAAPVRQYADIRDWGDIRGADTQISGAVWILARRRYADIRGRGDISVLRGYADMQEFICFH